MLSTNADLTARLLASFDRVRPDGKGDKSLGSLLLMLATAWPKEASQETFELVELHVGTGELDTAARVKMAIAVAKSAGNDPLTWETLKEECGVGIVQGEKEVQATLEAFLKEHSVEILAGRYPIANRLRSKFSPLLKWADGKIVSKMWEAGLLNMLGPKDSAENQAALEKKSSDGGGKEKKKKDDKKGKEGGKGKKEGKGQSSAAAAAAAVKEEEEEESLGLVAGMDKFGAPADNKQVRPELLAEHLKATDGRVVTRFPPEPNGYLHMGHALSMARVFGYAEAKGGYCVLRYDDTNPEAEKQEYIDSILNDVKWMGYKPAQVTFSSDYFDQLYAFAEQLIGDGLAYVCDMPMEEMREGRRLKIDSPFRNRSKEENLRLFRKMRDGYFDEGSCTLRVRGDMQHDNPNMRDFVAYRIKFRSHPHVGDKWCIYPSYDYTHAIVDSLENITHSICTLEFVSRNETYRWLLDALRLYKPPQLEAQRLKMTFIMLSKRKLLKLVNEGHVMGWADPRMPTIMGVRRKGYPPRAMHDFMLGMGISRSADGLVPLERLEEAIRAYYNTRAPRGMALKRPLAVVVDNWDENKTETVDTPDFPDEPERGSHSRIWSKHLFVDLADWRDEDSPKYYGLAPGKRVRLKYGYIVKHIKTERNAAGKPVLLHVEYEPDKTGKVKGTLSWLSKEESVVSELRLLKQLFSNPTPGVRQGANNEVIKTEFLEDLTENSLNPFPNALVEKRCAAAPIGSVFQFERMGYFNVDTDSNKEKTVFNRTVSSKTTKTKF